MRYYCKTCARFTCEVMSGSGEPLEDRGSCQLPGKMRRDVDADDYCNQHTVAKWAKKCEANDGK